MGKAENKDFHPVVTREFTVNVHRRIHGCTYKKRAPKAVQAVRKFVQQQMGTPEAVIDQALNEFLWSKGIRKAPFRVRIRCERKYSESEDGEKKLVSVVTHVPLTRQELRGMRNVTVSAE